MNNFTTLVTHTNTQKWKIKRLWRLRNVAQLIALLLKVTHKMQCKFTSFMNKLLYVFKIYSNNDKLTHFCSNCAVSVKSLRFGREYKQSISNNFLICHILWHFQDGRHWPWELYIGQKLKHAPISLKIVSICLLCCKDSNNV